MSVEGFLLQPTYRVRDGAPVVQLWGRLREGPAFLVEDDRLRPYCFVPAEARAALEGEAVRVEATELRDLRGRPVLRVETGLPQAMPALRERLAARGAGALEADLRFPYRFLVDRDLGATLSIEGDSEEAAGGLRVFRNPALAPAEGAVPLRTLSLDLETTPDASRIHSVAYAGCGTEEVHLVAAEPVPGAVAHADERRLLEAALARLRALDPDVLLGWNVVDFDLRVLLRRCEALGLAAELGRGPGATTIFQESSFARLSRAEVPGRVVLDGIALVRDALRLPDYRLETVARHVLGRGKKLDPDAPDAAAEIDRLAREEPEALAAYNLEDARLVPEILEREGLLALAVERSVLSGLPLDRVGASIASFDMLYLPRLRRAGFVAPSVDAERKAEAVRGGALLDPRPGLYADVAVFDFRSLYPSLIRTFALDPLAHARAGEDADAIAAPNGARFSREHALLPELIERFMARRAAARERGDRNAEQALKIMMNALFGVLGAGACRFFDPAIANAITGFGQRTLQWTREAFEAEGVAVLYGDTDSVFVQLRREGAAAGDDPAAAADALRARAEARVAERIRAAYGCEPLLELELQRVFARFFLPRIRSRRSGSKKRYAGLVDGRLVVVGLEAVRRDWPEVAHRLQEGMLERLFADEAVLPFVTRVVEELRAGERDAELVYVKRVRKGALDRYKAATPPAHVRAARKAGRLAGPEVRYVIARSGPEPVLPGRPLPERIDREHYVEKVLRPIAEAILAEIGLSFDRALGAPEQGTLF